jgi:NADPH2:quinone reductase
MMRGSLYVTRPTLGTHTATRELVENGARSLFAMVMSGKVKIDIGRRYPLDEAAHAQSDMEARKTTGSTILTID